MANFTYKVYYTLLIPVPEAFRKERDMVITATTPVRALDIFHKNVQSMESKSTNGLVTRPKLKPQDYVITSLVQRYPNEVKGLPMIEAPIDLPSSPNPDTTSKPKPEPTVQTEMPLDDARKSP